MREQPTDATHHPLQNIDKAQKRILELESKLQTVEVRDELTCFLLQHLASLQNIVYIVSQKEFLEKQTAQGVASLYEQIGSFTLRLLQASQPTVEQDEEEA